MTLRKRLPSSLAPFKPAKEGSFTMTPISLMYILAACEGCQPKVLFQRESSFGSLLRLLAKRKSIRNAPFWRGALQRITRNHRFRAGHLVLTPMLLGSKGNQKEHHPPSFSIYSFGYADTVLETSKKLISKSKKVGLP